MSNAKRAIMVPIMTLAVCAIAMVGLGFALTTSVTSNSNTVEKLMVDLSDSKDTLDSAIEPSNTNVDGVLSIGLSTHKGSSSAVATKSTSDTDTIYTCTLNEKTITTTITTTGSNNSAKIKNGTSTVDAVIGADGKTITATIDSIVYTTVIDSSDETKAITYSTEKTDIKTDVDDGFTYLKIFGNLNDVSLKVDVTGLSSSGVEAITLSIYQLDGTNNHEFGTNDDALSTATINTSNSNTSVNFEGSFKCDETYAVAITSINGNTITYTNSSGIKATCNNYISGIPENTIIGFTFTATTTAT